MGPLRRDTLPFSDSIPACNSKGGIMFGSPKSCFQSFLYKSTKSVIQIRRLTEVDLWGDSEIRRTDVRQTE